VYLYINSGFVVQVPFQKSSAQIDEPARVAHQLPLQAVRQERIVGPGMVRVAEVVDAGPRLVRTPRRVRVVVQVNGLEPKRLGQWVHEAVAVLPPARAQGPIQFRGKNQERGTQNLESGRAVASGIGI